jgi:hypothetical protein
MSSKKRPTKPSVEAKYDPEGLMRARIAYIHEAVLVAELAAKAMGVDADSSKYDPHEELSSQRAKNLPARGRLAIDLRRNPGLLPRPDFSNGTKRKAA